MIFVAPTFFVVAVTAMFVRAFFDHEYAAHFMGEDLAWLPIMFVMLGLPTIAIFILADGLALCGRKFWAR